MNSAILIGMTYLIVLLSSIAAAVGARKKAPALLCYVAAIMMLLLDHSLWIVPAIPGLIISSRYFWKNRKILLVCNVVILLAVVVNVAGILYFTRTGREITTIELDTPAVRHTVTPEMLVELPPPVRKWLEGSGVIGREMIREVELTQHGRMRLEPDQQDWAELQAQQFINVESPAFSWRVETSMKGLPVTGRDYFAGGEGSMEMRLLSMIPVVNVSKHHKLNESTLQRYLGEILWYPTAALHEYIQWEPIDAYNARAVMQWGATEGEAVFTFNASGEPVSFTAWRYRDIEDTAPTEWVAQVHAYSQMDGIMIPTKLSATWMLEEGAFTWFEFEVVDIMYR